MVYFAFMLLVGLVLGLVGVERLAKRQTGAAPLDSLKWHTLKEGRKKKGEKKAREKERERERERKRERAL